MIEQPLKLDDARLDDNDDGATFKDFLCKFLRMQAVGRWSNSHRIADEATYLASAPAEGKWKEKVQGLF